MKSYHCVSWVKKSDTPATRLWSHSAVLQEVCYTTDRITSMDRREKQSASHYKHTICMPTPATAP